METHRLQLLDCYRIQRWSFSRWRWLMYLMVGQGLVTNLMMLRGFGRYWQGCQPQEQQYPSHTVHIAVASYQAQTQIRSARSRREAVSTCLKERS